MTQQELAKRLRMARAACRLTQANVAAHIGLPRSAIAQIEAGNRSVKSLELEQLAALYGTDIRDLLSDEHSRWDQVAATRHISPHAPQSLGDLLNTALVLVRECRRLLMAISHDAYQREEMTSAKYRELRELAKEEP